MKEFIYPMMERGEQICCVYKMIFDCGSYYIGSAINLRSRINGWKFKLNSGIDKNYRVTEAFIKTSKVVFEIVDIVDDPIIRKFREDGYIKIYFGKPGCLNIAPNAFNNKGVKQNPNKKINTSAYKQVVKIDDYGNIIEKYKCVREANEKNNTLSVSDCFKNSLRKVKGMMFRELDNNGNIIPSPLPPLKERQERKKGYKISELARLSMKEKRALRKQSPNYIPPKLPPQTKQIYQYNLQNELIKEHQSILSASRYIGTDSKNFKKQINRSRTGFHKGYIWKYA